MSTLSLDHLYSIAEPWIVALPCEADEISNFAQRIENHNSNRLILRLVRGKKMRTETGLFDEVSAALQFPYYFGENWDALSECIEDLSWVLADAYILIVQDANEVLIDEPISRFSIFFRVLCDAGVSWHNPIDIGEWWDRAGKPFHTILHSAPNRLSDLEDRLGDISEVAPLLQL